MPTVIADMGLKGYKLNEFSAVVVTGGSSGIGAAFIKTISNIGQYGTLFNLSRTKPEINLPDGKLVHIPSDLTRAEDRAAAAEKVIAQAEKLPPGPLLLINNSGFGAYGVFPEPGRERHLEMIELNIVAPVDFTARLCTLFEARGGAIINIASTASFQPTPWLATYGATKAFLTHWSLSLDAEWRPKGVQVLTVCPGPTATHFFKAAGFDEPPASGIPGPTAEQVAEQSLQALEKGKSLLVPGWQNKIMTFFSSRLPKVLCTKLSAAVLKRVRGK